VQSKPIFSLHHAGFALRIDQRVSHIDVLTRKSCIAQIDNRYLQSISGAIHRPRSLKAIDQTTANTLFSWNEKQVN